MIELCPISDVKVEALLAELRIALLLGNRTIKDKSHLLCFQASLALQCFTNEYVYCENEVERDAVKALELEIEHFFARGEDPDWFKISCLASYRPLHRYSWSHNLDFPEILEGLFKRQVQEVLEEASLKPTIPNLEYIDDQVSNAVRQQYEENPFPRWVNLQLAPKPLSVLEVAKRRKLSLLGEFEAFSDEPKILIAGCGTGYHSLRTASRFSNSQVLAVDLSLSSLSHAVRKTRELGVSNIEYMQADILHLEKLNRLFDVVESVGVLHHMADPMAGWKVLVKCLKPGGLMRIGLYSELAHKIIKKARHLISTLGLGSSTNDIRKFREVIFTQGVDGELWEVVNSPDFFSTSACRDLFFHVQVHRFTLPQIRNMLDALGVTFVGFEFSDSRPRETFKRHNPDPQAAYSLDAWHEFETAYPKTFAGMYQFWVQKNAQQTNQ